MEIQKSGFLSIDQLADQYLSKKPRTDSTTNETGLTFEQVLQKKALSQSSVGQTDELKFSKHAAERLSDRNIELSREQLERLKAGTRKAEQKGIKDSLVIVDELAFIVNVPNHTVVTAMDSTQTDENVFTNINGAVII